MTVSEKLLTLIGLIAVAPLPKAGATSPGASSGCQLGAAADPLRVGGGAYPAMTNREALMHDLDALTDAQLAKVLNESTIDLALDKIICQDCKDEHGGKCPREKPDGPCVIDMAEWLGKPCKHDNLLEVPE